MRTKPKKLTLRQIHELYLLLRRTLPEKEERFLADEISAMLERMTEETARKALETLNISPDGKTGIYVLTMFVRELRQNNFFEYVRFINNLNDRKK